MPKRAPKKTPKKALGRGLASLLNPTGPLAVPLSALQDKRAPKPKRTSEGELRLVGVDELTPGTMQPRRQFGESEIAELAASIQRQGVLQPLLVRARAEGGYEIVAGERRWRAAQSAQLHQVPVLVRALDTQAALEVALIENIQRVDLNPMEESTGYARLMKEFNYTQAELAQGLGKSRSYVANSLRLQTLDPLLQAHVRTGRLAPSAARLLVGRKDGMALARRILRGGLNVRQAEALVSRKTPKRAPAKPIASADNRALERSLGRALGARVRIEAQTPTSGALVIHYDSLDALDALLRRLAPPKK